MANWKYHCELRFYDRKVRFTAVDLDRLMARFKKEVDAEVERSRAAKEYTYTIPNLKAEVCSSWAEFHAYEHS